MANSIQSNRCRARSLSYEWLSGTTGTTKTIDPCDVLLDTIRSLSKGPQSPISQDNECIFSHLTSGAETGSTCIQKHFLSGLFF